MGNLNETEKWEENIYQLETSDPVLGGADGISNRAPRQLANRTKWLKKKTEEAAQSLAEHVRSRNHPDATLTAKGFTQLSSATNSTSETLPPHQRPSRLHMTWLPARPPSAILTRGVR